VGTKNSAVQQVDQKLIYAGSEEGKLIALRNRIRQGIKPPVIIFVQSKARADELFRELVFENINVDVISADKTQAQRERTTQNFRDGKIWFLVATNLMSRGMDFQGVNLVINYDLPTTPTDYIHRVGRTGRMGKNGVAETYYTDEDVPFLKQIVEVLKQSKQTVPEFLLSLKTVDQHQYEKLKVKPLSRESISTDPKSLSESYKKKNNSRPHKKRRTKSFTRQNK